MATLASNIAAWIKSYCHTHNISSLVVGVSGGIDSAVTSTLCALTGLKTYAVNLPLHQKQEQYDLAEAHLRQLETNYSNVRVLEVELTHVFDTFVRELTNCTGTVFHNDLAFANTKSRLRMLTLYQIAQAKNGIVVGTGNKIEDFGVGFFTKYGDGGVDISPIADLMKSEVYDLGKDLGVDTRILQTPPTDGLWDDARNDETQLGASYTELEWAMQVEPDQIRTKRQREVYEIYQNLHRRNLHKMTPIPVYMKHK